MNYTMLPKMPLDRTYPKSFWHPSTLVFEKGLSTLKGAAI